MFGPELKDRFFCIPVRSNLTWVPPMSMVRMFIVNCPVSNNRGLNQTLFYFLCGTDAIPGGHTLWPAWALLRFPDQFAPPFFEVRPAFEQYHLFGRAPETARPLPASGGMRSDRTIDGVAVRRLV